MKTSLSAALVLLGSLGVASAAMAATPVARHPAEGAKVTPVKVMSETPNPHPGLAGALAASDGVIYVPGTNDPRTHGLPDF